MGISQRFVSWAIAEALLTVSTAPTKPTQTARMSLLR